LKYRSNKHVIPGAEGKEETCENIPKVLPVLLPEQPKQTSQGRRWSKGPGKTWNLNKAATSGPSVQEADLIQDCRSDVPDSRNPRSLALSEQL